MHACVGEGSGAQAAGAVARPADVEDGDAVIDGMSQLLEFEGAPPRDVSVLCSGCASFTVLTDEYVGWRDQCRRSVKTCCASSSKLWLMAGV